MLCHQNFYCFFVKIETEEDWAGVKLFQYKFYAHLWPQSAFLLLSISHLWLISLIRINAFEYVYRMKFNSTHKKKKHTRRKWRRRRKSRRRRWLWLFLLVIIVEENDMPTWHVLVLPVEWYRNSSNISICLRAWATRRLTARKSIDFELN